MNINPEASKNGGDMEWSVSYPSEGRTMASRRRFQSFQLLVNNMDSQSVNQIRKQRIYRHEKQPVHKSH
jgi:hypothetical protein